MISPRTHYSDNLVNYDGVLIQQNNSQPIFKNKDSYFNYSTSKQIVDTNFSEIVMFRRELFEKHGGYQIKNNIGEEELNLIIKKQKSCHTNKKQEKSSGFTCTMKNSGLPIPLFWRK